MNPPVLSPRLRALLGMTLVAFAVVASTHPGYAAGPAERPERKFAAPGRIEKHPKLESQLLAIANRARDVGVAEGLAVAREQSLRTQGERVRVFIQSRAERAVLHDALAARDVLIDAEYADLVQAYVPVTALREIAELPLVESVRSPSLPVADAVTDEGVAAANASAWHAAGFSGVGVKIGVIDLGFINYPSAQGSGDLPANVITADFGCGGLQTFTSHGTATASIVYKMAPSAQLYLICISTLVNLGQAADYAVAQGIGIVNHSIGWFNTSRGDGSGGPGSPDAIVASSRANGILWVNSAGNSAQQHWSGTFFDPDLDQLHNFLGSDELNSLLIGNGQQLCAWLRWDSWPATAQDYDLYLVRSADGVIVARSENFQTGTQRPTEQLCFANGSATAQFGIAIARFSASATPRFDLFVYSADLEYSVAAGSISEPASSPSAMAVGAVCWQNDALEPFSSQGPSIDGRIKPDITAADATSSFVYGPAAGCSLGFLGTSASAPHVAGAAALVLQANPGYSPTQLQSFLEGRAVDLGPGGRDSFFGVGKLSLGAVPPTGTTFEDTDPAVTFSGPWVPWTYAGNSGGSARYSATAGAQASFGFSGTFVTLVYVKSTDAGIATIAIDGATADNLDTYGPFELQQRKTYSGLAPGSHTVTIAVSGNKNPSSSATYIYLDAFMATAAATPTGTTVEDTDAAVTFSGPWVPWAYAGNSGGTARYSATAGAQASFGFTGTFVTLVFVKSTDAGIATIAIDGSIVDTLDTYGPFALQQRKTYSGLAAASHAITVTVSGNKNASSSGLYIYVDAFMATAVATPTGSIFEDDDPAVSFSSGWISWAYAGTSGGTAHYSSASGETATFRFTGTFVTLLYAKSTDAGIAAISIDGAATDNLDMYGAFALREAKTYNVADGSHVLKVTVSGNKNGAAVGTYVYVDAFRALGSAPPTTTVFDEASPAVAFSGAWTTWSASGHSGGSARYSSTAGASAMFRFDGSSVEIIYTRSTDAGIATVSLDGTAIDALDLYGPFSYQQVATYEIGSGRHTLTLSVSGTKNASSTGVYLYIDAFRAGDAVLEDQNPSVGFSGSWTAWPGLSHSDGTARYSAQTGAQCSLTFVGSTFEILYVRARDAGIASITIDGSLAASLDEFGPFAYQQLSATYSVAPGTHTVTITVSGTQNPSSSGAYIYVDAIVFH